MSSREPLSGTAYEHRSPFLLRVLLQPVYQQVPSRGLHACFSTLLYATYACALAIGLWYFTTQSTVWVTDISAEDRAGCQPLSADAGAGGYYRQSNGLLAKALTTLNENRLSSRLFDWNLNLQFVDNYYFENSMTPSKFLRDFMIDPFASTQSAMDQLNMTRGCGLSNRTGLITYEIGPYLGPPVPSAGPYKRMIILKYRDYLNSDGAFPADLLPLLLQCCTLMPSLGPNSNIECLGTVSEALWREFFTSSMPAMAKFVRSMNGPFVCLRQQHKSIYEALVLSFSVVISLDVFVVILLRFTHLELQARVARGKAAPSEATTEAVQADADQLQLQHISASAASPLFDPQSSHAQLLGDQTSQASDPFGVSKRPSAPGASQPVQRGAPGFA